MYIPIPIIMPSFKFRKNDNPKGYMNLNGFNYKMPELSEEKPFILKFDKDGKPFKEYL